jgi:hypothetical protein
MRDKMKKLIPMIFLLLLTPIACAATTFFDQDDSFIIGNSTTSGMVEEKIETTTSGGGSTGIMRNVTNESVIATPEQIVLPTPIAERNDSERKILFDIGVKITNKQIIMGDNMTAAISLINLGVSGRVNITATYGIIDSEGNTVYRESEIVSVETQLEFLKDFDISGLDEGTYTLLSEIKYEGQKEPARAEDVFYVKKTAPQKFGMVILLVLGVVLVSLLAIGIVLKKKIYFKMLAEKVHVHFPSKPKKK